MLIPIIKGVFMLEAPNNARIPYCNSLYLEGEDRILIDASMGTENLVLMLEKNLDVIINSHFHEDHILNNHCFPQAQIWAHKLDAPAITDLEVFCDYYGFAAGGVSQLGYDFIQSIQLKPSPVHKEIEDKQEIHINGLRWHVIHTPGHTPGHCAFYNEKHGVLFSSDVDLSGFGPWYGHACSDVDDFIRSIQILADLDAQVVISSHKGIINKDISERFQQYLDVLYRKENNLLEFVRTPRDLEEIVNQQIIYGDKAKFDDFMRFFERLSVIIHLKRLIKMGEVKQEGTIYFRT